MSDFDERLADFYRSIVERYNLDETDEGCLRYIADNTSARFIDDEAMRLSLVIEYWDPLNIFNRSTGV